MRVALYCRVSTEDQAIHGLSIDTQLTNLRDWAKNSGHTIVREYVDAGISGKKPPNKRPALSQFFSDLENGLSVDILAFTKLDRFFRSVKLYYQAVDVLDRHKVAWTAIQEDYETMTSAGRFRTNIMLSIAEAEADRTSERIKVVFDRKIANGEPIGGNNVVPLGYKIENKQVVLSESAEAVKAFFDYYERTGSIHGSMDYMREEQGIPIVMSTARRMLKNKAYTGVYRDNPSFFPQIIPLDQFDNIQKMLAARSIRKNKTDRVYLFSGLIKCKNCGRNLVGIQSSNKCYYYRCQRAVMNRLCINNHHISELKMEQWLLQNVEAQFEGYVESHQAPKVKKKKVDVSTVKKKLEKLKDLYLDDLITKEQYKEDYDKLQSLLRLDNEPSAPDYNEVRKIIKETLKPSYGQLTRQHKRTLWRSIIDHIEVDKDGNQEFFFNL